jgi:hypothetical protein
MRCCPVEFYAKPVFVIEIVQVSAARALPDSRLPSRGRQPMRTFDAADVAMLQNRQDSLIDAAKRRCDLAAPAHFLACVHSQAYPVCCGTPPADGPANPRVRVVEVRCDLDEIKHRVLDAGTRREHHRMPGPQDGV